jgi:hypothetical protein
MKKFFAVLLLMTAVIVPTWAQTGNRYALVIGNNNYKKGIKKLSTPVNDATAISAALTKLGYVSDLKINLDIDDLDEAIDQFLEKLDNNRESEGFFWFAGHGLNINNKHYLLAVDVDTKSDNSIIRGSYSVDKLVEDFGNVRNKANLIVIDACRNDSLPGKRMASGAGLAQVSVAATKGNVITYSTEGGKTADDGKPSDKNSPFAAAFLSNIGTVKSYDNLFIQIAHDTSERTKGKQTPSRIGSFKVENYSIAPIATGTEVVQLPRPGTIVPEPPTVIPPLSPPRKPINPAIGYSLLNIAFGAGSYFQGDITSGFIVTGCHLAATGLILFEIYGVKRGETFSCFSGNTGVVLGGVSLAFGSIMPFIFEYINHQASAIGNFDIGLVSSEQNKTALAIKFTYSF